MLAGFPAVLLLLGLAHASPVSLVSTAVPHVLKHPSSTARWDCDVKAYVRAPDLSPNVLLQGDARLVANGTACTDLVGWQLGLVMKERAIVRLVAEGATLPSQPKYNELEAEAWDEHREDPWNDVYPVTWRLLGDQRQSPWDVAMEAYQSAMANVSLWQVHGAERAIFDLKVDLASATGPDSIPFESVKSFGIAVPNVNLPPTPGDIIYQIGGEDRNGFAETEAMFGYYFSLKLRNGSTINVPAGQTVFIPASPPVAAERSVNSVRILLEPSMPKVWDRQPISSITNCTIDNSSRFAVDVHVPEDSTFHSGKELWLNTTIYRISGLAQNPTAISFRPQTIESKTWAAKFAHSEDEKMELTRSEFGSPSAMMWDLEQTSTIKMAEPVRSSEEEQDECSRHEKSPYIGWYRGSTTDGPGWTKLDPTLAQQTVLVNFTIPADMLPSFNATFSNFVSFLQVTLVNEQACGQEEPRDLAADDDLHDDSLWSAWPSSCRQRRRKRDVLIAKHYGNSSITILSPLIVEGALPVHYSDPSAPSPVLFTVPPLSQPKHFPLLGSDVVSEQGNQLRRRRYLQGHWGRLGESSFHHVGQVWARKVQRMKERSEQQQRSALVVQV